MSYKQLFFLSLFMLALTSNAQEKIAKKMIKNCIEKFFDGFHKGDSALVNKTLHKDLKIQTTFTKQNGTKVLKTDQKKQLLITIANKKPNLVYLEKLLSFEIKIDGNLASVWTPYEFYLNGKFSHCGANSFQLFNNNGTWQIIYLIDMRRRTNCKAVKEKY